MSSTALRLHLLLRRLRWKLQKFKFGPFVPFIFFSAFVLFLLLAANRISSNENTILRGEVCVVVIDDVCKDEKEWVATAASLELQTLQSRSPVVPVILERKVKGCSLGNSAQSILEASREQLSPDEYEIVSKRLSSYEVFRSETQLHHYILSLGNRLGAVVRFSHGVRLEKTALEKMLALRSSRTWSSAEFVSAFIMPEISGEVRWTGS